MQFVKADVQSVQVLSGKLSNKTNLCVAFCSGIEMRDIIILECTECKQRNYTTTKNKKKQTGRVEYKKYCRFCDKHTLHKETR